MQVLAAFFFVLAIGLAIASTRGWIKNELLDRWDKVASIVSLLLALALLVFSSGSSKDSPGGEEHSPQNVVFSIHVVDAASATDIADARVYH